MQLCGERNSSRFSPAKRSCTSEGDGGSSAQRSDDKLSSIPTTSAFGNRRPRPGDHAKTFRRTKTQSNYKDTENNGEKNTGIAEHNHGPTATFLFGLGEPVSSTFTNPALTPTPAAEPGRDGVADALVPSASSEAFRLRLERGDGMGVDCFGGLRSPSSDFTNDSGVADRLRPVPVTPSCRRRAVVAEMASA